MNVIDNMNIGEEDVLKTFCCANAMHEEGGSSDHTQLSVDLGSH